MMTQITPYTFLGLGIIGGFFLGLIYLDILYKSTMKTKLDFWYAQYNNAIAKFGISRNKDGQWIMKPEDRDEFWIKKE
jgi:hypothetical protein